MNDKEMFHVKRQYSFPGFAKNDFDLSTQARPYRLARLGTSQPKAKRLIVFSRRYAPKNIIRLPPSSGEADAKEKEFIVLKYLYIRL
ncbi:MAG: hypothetical protein ACLTM5_05755 [Dialister sp.]